jgi:alanine-glyoxylate transaminase/serine-glyoxylate transaminase/serine-pyruvate transaminase
MYGLIESMKMIQEEGLDNVFARHHYLAEGVRAAVTLGWQLKLCAAEAKWHSDTVTAVMLPQGIAGTEVIARAYRRYNLSLGGGLSKVAGKLFRIGHLGDMNEVHLMAAINGAEMAMLDCGVAVAPGSGAAAAGNYWRSHAAPESLGAPHISKDEHAKNRISGQAIIKS